MKQKLAEPGKFAGLTSPRQARALIALADSPRAREELDRVTGASNSPSVVARLRRMGLQVPCTRRAVIDRDGKQARPGEYCLSAADLEKVRSWRADLAHLAKPAGP